MLCADLIEVTRSMRAVRAMRESDYLTLSSNARRASIGGEHERKALGSAAAFLARHMRAPGRRIEAAQPAHQHYGRPSFERVYNLRGLAYGSSGAPTSRSEVRQA